MISVSVVLPEPSRRTTAADAVAMRAEQFQHHLNSVSRINADWVLREWEAGRAPKCCAKCNGTRYVPDVGDGDGMSTKIEILSSPVLFARGAGSCGSIAACHTGHKIAEAVAGTLDVHKYGRMKPMSWDEACHRFIVQMRPGPDPRKPMLLHAICNDNGLVLDPTIGMAR